MQGNTDHLAQDNDCFGDKQGRNEESPSRVFQAMVTYFLWALSVQIMIPLFCAAPLLLSHPGLAKGMVKRGPYNPTLPNLALSPPCLFPNSSSIWDGFQGNPCLQWSRDFMCMAQEGLQTKGKRWKRQEGGNALGRASRTCHKVQGEVMGKLITAPKENED